MTLAEFNAMTADERLSFLLKHPKVGQFTISWAPTRKMFQANLQIEGTWRIVTVPTVLDALDRVAAHWIDPEVMPVNVSDPNQETLPPGRPPNAHDIEDPRVEAEPDDILGDLF